MRRRRRPGPSGRPRGDRPHPFEFEPGDGLGDGGGARSGWRRGVGPGPEPVEPGQAEDGQVVGLGPARGEDDLVRSGPRGSGRPTPGRRSNARRAPRPAAWRLSGLPPSQPVRPHRLEDLGVERRRRVVVEVDRRHGGNDLILGSKAGQPRLRRVRSRPRTKIGRPRIERRPGAQGHAQDHQREPDHQAGRPAQEVEPSPPGSRIGSVKIDQITPSMDIQPSTRTPA